MDETRKASLYSRLIMPKPLYNVMILLRLLDDEYLRWAAIHRKNTPTGIPVGGGEWMDSFFKMEAIRGVVSALRNTCSVSVAIKKGKQQSTFAVSKWNSQRGYQVHRWNQTAWSWLEGLVYSLKRKA